MDPASVVMYGNSVELMLKALVIIIAVVLWPLLKKK